MRSYEKSGQRVVAARFVDGYKRIPRGWVGTVDHEEDNGVGRTLLYVVWDQNGERWPVFPDDVSLLDSPNTQFNG